MTKRSLSLTFDLKTSVTKAIELKGLTTNPYPSKHTQVTSLLDSLAQQKKSFLAGGGAEISRVQ